MFKFCCSLMSLIIWLRIHEGYFAVAALVYIIYVGHLSKSSKQWPSTYQFYCLCKYFERRLATFCQLFFHVHIFIYIHNILCNLSQLCDILAFFSTTIRRLFFTAAVMQSDFRVMQPPMF